jgi:hypothetical protein
MFSNRISRFTEDQFSYPVFAVRHAASAQSLAGAQTFGGNGNAMVLVPGTVQAPWQVQLYRLAYEKALIDTAPPQYLKRFSVWN